MFIAKCYNWNFSDEFLVIEKTKKSAIELLTKAYSERYAMTLDQLQEIGYSDFESYLREEKELQIFEVKSGDVFINDEKRNTYE